MDYEQNEITKKITVSGIVQGVGFRPFVYRLAQKYGIKGTVQNMGGLVEIILQSSKESFDDFLHMLKAAPCPGCEIHHVDVEDVTGVSFQDFRIIHSGDSKGSFIPPPDLPVCPECEGELRRDKDRRYLNPFISCMSCGPRYTIIESLPYDRETTTMQDFAMCPQCRREYIAPNQRRFHAQTISCHDCGPYLIFDDTFKQDAFEKAVALLKDGGILAVKGIGGYHFVCSPFWDATVENLRQLKGRDEKPFAVMFPSIEVIRVYCQVSPEEEVLLNSRAKPIVLLYEKKKLADSVSKGSMYCGAFLPYTPLQIMLTEQCGPLIMTSANIADQPIIKEDEAMQAISSRNLNGILYHKRRILRSVDDSVAKVIDKKPQIIRRSRGYVPYPVFLPKRDALQIFAAGGDLKSAFCLYKDGNGFVSQHFGDLEQAAVFGEYQNAYADLCRILQVNPSLVVCDLHPNYHSAGFARSLELPMVAVQHHHAHVTSVMAEHQLTGKVIGVAFDGTGYGTDGSIWGGEFLVCEGDNFQRAAHLESVPVLGGDASMKDAKKTAACYLLHAGLEEYIEDDRKDLLKAALYNNINTVQTSSMGRLFDAVSSLLGIADANHYEGKCAAMLEKEAYLAGKAGSMPKQFNYTITQNKDKIIIKTKSLLEGLCQEKKQRNKGSLALGFHYATAEMILQVCETIRMEYKTKTVALCGGVFQNTILMEKTIELLREKGFSVFYNRAVPPNDGAISLGQAYLGLMR